MNGFRHDVAGGDGNLIATSVQSPDFVAGSEGWQIRKDGSAEFNDVTIRGGEVVGGQALYYSPSAGAGNLTASISGTAGTDSFSDPYLAGITTYLPSGFAMNMQGNNLAWYALTGGTAWTAQEVGVGFSDGGVQLYGILAQMWVGAWQDDSGSLVTGPRVTLGKGVAMQAADPDQPGANPPIAETWHNMSLVSGWSTAATGYARYRLGVDNRVYVQGANVIPGTVTGGTNIWAIPSGYIPGVETARIPMVIENSTGSAGVETPRFDAGTAATFACFNVPSSTTRIGFNHSYPLD